LLEGLPEPRPFREIFVYGTEVEGVHLRFGKVARGGLRWSDRAQDYRTEVLGLVKAQQVKNAVIVPVGAKGGFFPKRLPIGGSREEIFQAGTSAYKTFIRTLLSITDNIVDQDIVPPTDTVRLDGDDPYFVVAADKGTATFSDIANALAQEAGFWLDDAFASGGSAGYDHKKMGITARGAWETVKRHFREMNTDIQTTPFDVVGVGDMSGDVFGNGMMLSEKIRLIAAFDHRDIFIDPNPDIGRSYAERKRLFNLPRSSWQDYDRASLSPGAMIVSRSEKSVPLTPEAAAAIHLDSLQTTPIEIMTAILKSPVDLLWFGGIGTYVRGPDETDPEVGDRTNDLIRISANDVRARVIGGGANLGVTQRGRIAFGLNGGRCNSDAIDNSAGVNSSDLEVNIKIALATALHNGSLGRDERNELLELMTDEVSALVLRNNYEQSLVISLTEMLGAKNYPSLARLMSRLESDGRLNRSVEVLPTDTEMSERYQSGKPLSRAEIGVLLSYSKLALFDEIIKADLPDDPYFRNTLMGYFPAKMHDAHASDIESHRLRREIIATVLANDILNLAGPAFVSDMVDLTRMKASDIVRTAVIARDGCALSSIRREIDALDNAVDGEVQNELYQEVSRAHAAITELILQSPDGAENLGQAVAGIESAIQILTPKLPRYLSAGAASAWQEAIARLVGRGVPELLAERIAGLNFLAAVPEILQISVETGAAFDEAAIRYFTVDERVGILNIIDAARRLPAADVIESAVLSRCCRDNQRSACANFKRRLRNPDLLADLADRRSVFRLL